MHSMSLSYDCDVLVVGAGPVGLTLASELTRHGVFCRIIDKAQKAAPGRERRASRLARLNSLKKWAWRTLFWLGGTRRRVSAS